MRWACCVLSVAVLAIGCGGGGGPELPVNGIVLMDGNPLDNAAVTFFPEDKGTAMGGMARTGSDGKFVILGAKGQKGLPPGKYKVTVSKRKGGAVTDEPVIAAPSEAELNVDDLPPIYSDPNRTILSFSVTGDGKPIEIKLDSKRKQ